jgi:hypothetical protein
VYDEAGIIAITPGSTNPTVTERGLGAMFRMCGRDDQQGIVAGDYIVDVLKGKKIAVINDKDTYGKGLADATAAQLTKRGVKPVLEEGLTRGEKDFSALVTKIRSTGADVVYFGGLHPEAGPLVRQIREAGLKDVKFMSDDGIVTDELVTTAGGPQFVDGPNRQRHIRQFWRAGERGGRRQRRAHLRHVRGRGLDDRRSRRGQAQQRPVGSGALGPAAQERCRFDHRDLDATAGYRTCEPARVIAHQQAAGRPGRGPPGGNHRGNRGALAGLAPLQRDGQWILLFSLRGVHGAIVG